MKNQDYVLTKECDGIRQWLGRDRNDEWCLVTNFDYCWEFVSEKRAQRAKDTFGDKELIVTPLP